MTRTVLVTGSASGIGRSIAEAFFANGWNVAAAMRRREDASYARLTKRNDSFVPLPLDVRDADAVERAVELTIRLFGTLDVLVNNAGCGLMGPIETIDLDAIESLFSTNTIGPLRLIRAVVPHMRARGRGRIINISSAGGEFTLPFAGAYHASKYALEALSDALRGELAPFGIDVVVVQPGPVRTKLAQAAVDQMETHATGSYRSPVANFAAAARRQLDSGALVLAPERVSQIVLAAATARKPATRYRVGLAAKTMPHLRRWLGDRNWDRLWTPVPSRPVAWQIAEAAQ